MAVSITWLLPMNFSTRLAKIRKFQGLSQQRLADTAELYINQIRRYEAGSAQAIKKLSTITDINSKAGSHVRKSKSCEEP